MSDRVDELAESFVRKDDFFKTVPTEEVDKWKDTLRPIFEKQYTAKYDKKLGEMLEVLREETLKHKDDIILKADSEKDVVGRMEDKIDDLVRYHKRKDGFMSQVKKDEVDIVKNDLDSLFVKAYRDKMKEKIDECVDFVASGIMQQQENLINRSDNNDDCLEKL
eukprot:UN29403